jgi:glycerol uptake facilitator-like aquaporin
MFSRKQIAVLLAEFVGTAVLALVMLSVQHSVLNLQYFVALAVGLTLAALVSTFDGNGVSLFNPAVTIGMWTVRKLSTLRALAYIVAEMLGAWAAYGLYTYFIKSGLQSVGGDYDGRILVAEAVGAFVLALAYAAAVFNGYTTARKAMTVGAAYTLAVILAASATIGIINPALAFSVRAFDVFGSMGWTTYALGPILGAVIGFNVYALLFAPESSLIRVRAAVNQRLGRTQTAAAAPSTDAAPARRGSSTGRSAAARRSTRTTRTAPRSRKTTTTTRRRSTR